MIFCIFLVNYIMHVSELVFFYIYQSIYSDDSKRSNANYSQNYEPIGMKPS